MPARPWTATAESIALAVRLTSRGGRDAIDGIETLSDRRAVLKIRVRAAPSEGEANAALVRLLAKSLEVPARSIVVVGGTTARMKRMVIGGDQATLLARLEKFTAAR